MDVTVWSRWSTMVVGLIVRGAVWRIDVEKETSVCYRLYRGVLEEKVRPVGRVRLEKRGDPTGFIIIIIIIIIVMFFFLLFSSLFYYYLRGDNSRGRRSRRSRVPRPTQHVHDNNLPDYMETAAFQRGAPRLCVGSTNTRGKGAARTSAVRPNDVPCESQPTKSLHRPKRKSPRLT